MNKQSLKKEIEKKLKKLEQLLDKIDGARAVEIDDPQTWDKDTLAGLAKSAKKLQELLEDEIDPKKRNEFGEPLILEEGLCSLVSEYKEEENEDDDDE